MKLKVNINNAQLEFEGRDVLDVMREGAAFTQIRSCGNCGKADISLEYRQVTAQQGENKGKTFEYVQLCCKHCGAKSQVNQAKNGSYYFKDDWNVYNKNTSTVMNQPHQAAQENTVKDIGSGFAEKMIQKGNEARGNAPF